MTSSYLVAPATTVGVDLSDRFTSFCVLDSQGEILEESKVRTTPEAFERRFGGVGSCRMVMEVGTHSPWASRKLAEWETGFERRAAHLGGKTDQLRLGFSRGARKRLRRRRCADGNQNHQPSQAFATKRLSDSRAH